MEFEDIIPNGPKGQPIKNKAFINYLTKCITLHYSVKGEQYFPGPQPVSIEKKDFEKFVKYKYNIGLKLDGVRFLMYFIRDKNNTTQCILVNRALQYYIINIDTDEDAIYNETLLDGELLYNKTTSKWDFSIHDAVILCGNKINKQSHSQRLMDTKCCIDSFIENKDSNTVNILIKEFHMFSDITNFIDNVYTNVNSDGIIFMPENLPVISGTQYSMFKWKPPDKHTFDFLITEVEDNFEVHVYHLNKMVVFAKIHNNIKEGNEFIQNTKNLDNYKNECILECNFDKSINNFKPLLIRTDKTHPNSLRTIERTLFNINENITLNDYKNIKLNVNEVTE
jgi:hypothetical protein